MTSARAPIRSDAPAVIFDLDGTLADTLEDITDTMNVVLAELDRPPVTASRMRRIIGEGLGLLVKRATGIDDDAQIAVIVDRYQPLYYERMLCKARLYPGVDRALDALSAAGVPLAVLSNKPHRFTVPICDVLLGRWPFVAVRGPGGEGPTDLRKPDPTLALELAERMGRLPGEVYFVGDSEIDVRTARNAGMIAVAVTWGFRDRDELSAAKPDHVIDEPMEVVRLLGVG